MINQIAEAYFIDSPSRRYYLHLIHRYSSANTQHDIVYELIDITEKDTYSKICEVPQKDVQLVMVMLDDPNFSIESIVSYLNL